MKLFRLALVCTVVASLPLIAQQSKTVPKEYIRVLSVKPTPEPETVVAVVQLPKQGQVVKGNPVWLQMRVDGYALGSNSQFDRASEVVNSKLGQTIHVVIDNHPYFPINGPSIEPFNEEGWYYNQSYKFEVPFKLQNGIHFVRIYPARSFGESLKGERTFFSTYFYVGKKMDESRAEELSKPYLTYNEPSDQTHLVEGKPVLLDFYISNCELTPDGYKVRMTVDGKLQRTLTSWQPYYIYGLKKGKHTMRLELIDDHNELVQGPYSDLHETFFVQSQ